ncbi:hypothetical protein V6Z11_A01G123600 [Gossypium hirsutum]
MPFPSINLIPKRVYHGGRESCLSISYAEAVLQHLLLNLEVYRPCQLFPSLSETKFSTFTLKSIFSRWVKVLKLSASVALLLWMFLLLVDPSDSLIVAVKPKALSGLDIDDDEEDLKFQLPQSTSWWKKKLYSFLLNRLKLPDTWNWFLYNFPEPWTAATW